MISQIRVVHALKLGGLIHLTVGQIYEQQALDGIKYELEALHGVKLMKLFDEKTLYLLCNNYGIKHNCKSYYAKFSIQFRANRLTKRIFILDEFMTMHHQDCYLPEMGQFFKNLRVLNLHYDAIIKLVKKLMQNQYTNQLPTQVMELLCEQEGLDKNFLHEGLTNAELRRKIKKKFDNIVAEARRRYKHLLGSYDQKMKSSEDDMAEETPEDKCIFQIPIKVDLLQDNKRKDQELTEHSSVTLRPVIKKIRKTVNKNKNYK